MLDQKGFGFELKTINVREGVVTYAAEDFMCFRQKQSFLDDKCCKHGEMFNRVSGFLDPEPAF